MQASLFLFVSSVRLYMIAQYFFFMWNLDFEMAGVCVSTCCMSPYHSWEIKTSNKAVKRKAHITAHEPNPLRVLRAQFVHTHTQTYRNFSFLHTPLLFCTWKIAFVFFMCSGPFFFDVCMCECVGEVTVCTAYKIIIEHPLNWFQLFFTFTIIWKETRRNEINYQESRMREKMFCTVKEQQFHCKAFNVPGCVV